MKNLKKILIVLALGTISFQAKAWWIFSGHLTDFYVENGVAHAKCKGILGRCVKVIEVNPHNPTSQARVTVYSNGDENTIYTEFETENGVPEQEPLADDEILYTWTILP